MTRAISEYFNVPELRIFPTKTYTIPQTDLTVSRLAYGCALLAGWNRQPLCNDDVATAIRLVNTALEQGITFFDLANYYGFRKSEVVFGEVLKQSPGLRHKIVIQSKCGVLIGADTQLGGAFRPDCSGHRLVSFVEDSLQRLGVEYLDILLIHWPDILARPQEIAQAFDTLKRGGKVRYFGVSNHTASQIELLRTSVAEPLVVNQIPLSLQAAHLIAGGLPKLWNVPRDLQDYTAIAAALDYCRANNIQVQAYSPLRGHLLNPPPDAPPEARRASRLLAELAAQKNTNSSAIALAWLLHHPAAIVPIVGSTNPEHLIDNCAADRVCLTRQEWYDLLISTLKLEP